MKNLISIQHQDPALRAFMLLMQVAGGASRYADSLLYQDKGISLSKYIALKALTSNSGKMTHGEMAVWTNTRQHNITTLVRRMQKEDLVTTMRDDKDKRVVFINITPKGQDIYDRASVTAFKVMDQLMQGIGKNKALQFERLLNVLKVNMQQAANVE